MSRLDLVDPPLDLELAEDADRASKASAAAVQAAFQSAGIHDPELVRAANSLPQPSADVQAIRRRAEAMDEEYLEVHGRFAVDADSVNRDEHLGLGCRARAAAALAFALEGEHGEAIYEAMAADLDSDAPLIAARQAVKG